MSVSQSRPHKHAGYHGEEELSLQWERKIPHLLVLNEGGFLGGPRWKYNPKGS